MAGVEGRVALVTGAGSPGGIGFATARILADRGALVAITSTTARIRDRLDELPGPASNKAAFVADLMKPKAAIELAVRVTKALGPIAILVNNAGMTQIGRKDRASRFDKISDAEWDDAIARNLTTAFRMTRAVLPSMYRRGYGRIVHVSSVTGPVVSNPNATGYSAAKAGMLGMTRSLAIEAGPKGVTVNAVGPGWIQTASSREEEIIAGRNTPAGRPGTPDEIGHVCAFLASEEASYLTGQLIVVDGGNTIQEYKGPSEAYY
ncbi:MAG: SDR family NAD(P)-dependent oxidoreductase [Dongiaceae bacterium]